MLSFNQSRCCLRANRNWFHSAWMIETQSHDIRSSEAGGPAGGRGKTGKERQSHNLLLLLNVMGSSLEEVPGLRFR